MVIQQFIDDLQEQENYILIGETIAKYGYDPRKLSTRSPLRIIARCSRCTEKMEVFVSNYIRTYSDTNGRCHSCEVEILKPKQMAKLRKQHRKLTKFQESKTVSLTTLGLRYKFVMGKD